MYISNSNIWKIRFGAEIVNKATACLLSTGRPNLLESEENISRGICMYLDFIIESLLSVILTRQATFPQDTQRKTS